MGCDVICIWFRLAVREKSCTMILDAAFLEMIFKSGTGYSDVGLGFSDRIYPDVWIGMNRTDFRYCHQKGTVARHRSVLLFRKYMFSAVYHVQKNSAQLYTKSVSLRAQRHPGPS